MLARLPAGWRADPAHRERAEEALRTRAAKRRRRFTRLPEEVPGLVVETAPAAARHAAGTCGCQRAGPGFNANALVPWTCAVDPLVRSGHATGTPVCPEGVSP